VTALFNRFAVVTVGTIQFTALDFAFRIERSLKPEPNTCDLDIWGLTLDHCNELAQLAPKKGAEATRGIPCKIEAGYEDATSLLWLGDLRTAETIIDGPERVTHLSSGDGEKALQHARLHASYGPKTPVLTVIRGLIKALGIDEGNLAKFESKLRIAGSDILPTGYSSGGSAAKALVELTRSAGLEFSIQEGAAFFLERGKALTGTAVRLHHETGLIGSPSVDNEGILTARTLMIRDIRLGGLVVVDAEHVQGNFRVERYVVSGDTAAADWGFEITGSRY
jgi:hypothetical protein